MLSAKWCGACQIMKPIVEEMKDVEIIDVEENPEIADKYNIMSLPAFIVDGTEIKIKFGSMPKQMLEEFYGKV